MSMPLTVLEAHVAPERESALRAAYTEAAQGPFPPGLVRSTLSRATNDPTLWRIDTVWESPEALIAMRGSGTPRGIQIFRAAGAEPTVCVLEVVATLSPPRGAA
jgi:hypothetical protein